MLLLNQVSSLSGLFFGSVQSWTNAFAENQKFFQLLKEMLS